MMSEVFQAIIFSIILMSLGPLASIYVKNKNLQIDKSLRLFVGITVVRLSAVGLYSYFLIKNGGNLFAFLITFATVYSVLLVPEVIFITRIMSRNR